VHRLIAIGLAALSGGAVGAGEVGPHRSCVAAAELMFERVLEHASARGEITAARRAELARPEERRKLVQELAGQLGSDERSCSVALVAALAALKDQTQAPK
jgi:hypothetical protein